MYETESVLGLLPLVLRPSDVSAALGVSIDYARALFRSGDLPVITIGKRNVITQTTFLDWLEGKIITNERE